MRLLAVDDHRLTHVLQDGQHEGGRLAGARLGAAHDVAAGEHARDGVLLDRCRLRVAHRGDAGEQLAFEAQCRERRDLDLGGRSGGLLDVLALLVALVDALAAAVAAVAAVTLAAALAAAVVAARAVVRGRGSRRARRSARCARRRRPARPAPERLSRLRPANPAPKWPGPAKPAGRRSVRRLPRRHCRARLPPRLRRRFSVLSADAAPSEERSAGAGMVVSVVLGVTDALFLDDSVRDDSPISSGAWECSPGISGVRGSSSCGGPPSGRPDSVRTGVPFLQNTARWSQCLWVACGRKARRVAPRRETGSRLLNQTLSGLHSTLKCGRSSGRGRGPELRRSRRPTDRASLPGRGSGARPAPVAREALASDMRASASASTARRSSSPRQSVATTPWPSADGPGPRRRPAAVTAVVHAAPRAALGVDGVRPRRSRRTRRRREPAIRSVSRNAVLQRRRPPRSARRRRARARRCRSSDLKRSMSP